MARRARMRPIRTIALTVRPASARAAAITINSFRRGGGHNLIDHGLLHQFGLRRLGLRRLGFGRVGGGDLEIG
jgi:hypothetical protein